MKPIRVYSSKRINPTTGEVEFSKFYRTEASIASVNAIKIENWYGVTPEMLDNEGRILASELHASMTAKPYTVIKPKLDTLKATGEVISASELSKLADEKAQREAEFAKAAEERIRENRDRPQGQPVQPTTRTRD